MSMKPRGNPLSEILLMASAFAMMDTSIRRHTKEDGSATNGRFMRFETNGFITYSYNQAAHDLKYAKYCKKKGL